MVIKYTFCLYIVIKECYIMITKLYVHTKKNMCVSVDTNYIFVTITYYGHCCNIPWFLLILINQSMKIDKIKFSWTLLQLDASLHPSYKLLPCSPQLWSADPWKKEADYKWLTVGYGNIYMSRKTQYFVWQCFPFIFPIQWHVTKVQKYKKKELRNIYLKKSKSCSTHPKFFLAVAMFEVSSFSASSNEYSNMTFAPSQRQTVFVGGTSA